MMFSKLAFFFSLLSALFLFASAAPTASNWVNQCNVGDAYCCNQETYTDSEGIAEQWGLGAALGSAHIPVAVGCTSAAALIAATGGTKCSNQPVCCQGNQFNSDVVFGCTPVNTGVN